MNLTEVSVKRNGRKIVAPDITSMMHSAIRAHINCPEPDAVLNIETHLFNVILEAKTANYGLDVGKQLWLNKQRWSRLIKEYLPLEPWNRFKSQALEILGRSARVGATANMLFRDPERYDKKHRWGGCLMGAVFRGDNLKAGPATLTFYSRTTYIGYMGLLDACIGHVMAREIWQSAFDTGSGEIPIRFHWHIASSQLHCFKTLPFIYSQPDLMAKLEKFDRNRALVHNKSAGVSPTWHHLAKWYFKVVDAWENVSNKYTAEIVSDPDIDPKELACEEMLSSEKYGPFRRIKRRWLESQRHLAKHVPPSLMASELDFDKAF